MITTHILDIGAVRPARGVHVELMERTLAWAASAAS